ncbi:MAG: pentapeptide repeat-containing protein [Pontimonas sp.]
MDTTYHYLSDTLLVDLPRRIREQGHLHLLDLTLLELRVWVLTKHDETAERIKAILDLPNLPLRDVLVSQLSIAAKATNDPRTLRQWWARKFRDYDDPTYEQADLSRANMRGADLRLMDIDNFDFTEADLSGADLSGAVITGSTLRYATLFGAYLRDASICECDLYGAYCVCCCFNGANLDGTSLNSAVTCSTSFSGTWFRASRTKRPLLVWR